MGMALETEEDEYGEEMPISNPLPPAPRSGGGKDRRDRDHDKENGDGRAANLSNADFRKMVMETNRKGDDKGKDKSRRYSWLSASSHAVDSDVDSDAHSARQKFLPMQEFWHNRRKSYAIDSDSSRRLERQDSGRGMNVEAVL